MKETDLRYVKTERAIRDAFFELLEESDFDKVSVTDITQRAQINRNTFYLHYSDKFNLVNSILIDFVQELSQQALKVIDQAEKPDTATFNQYFLTIFVSANRIKKEYRILFRSRNIEPYLDIAAITDVIADHIGKNKFLDFRSQRSSVSKSFLAFGFFGALNDYCSNDYTKEETVRMISAMSAGLAEIAQQLHAAGNKVGNGNKSNK